MPQSGSVFGAGRTKPPKCFEIKLDSPFVVFDGDAHEAEPVELSGTLHLSNPDHMNVRSIKIKLEGKWKVSWLVEPTVSSLTIRDKGIIIDEELMLYPTEGQSGTVTHKIAPGCHEWRFKFLLDPFIPESVEGLAGSFVVYDLKAEIDRGYMSKNLLADKHVRVIRALGRDMTETVPMPYSNEDTWKDKLWYHIYVPTRYYIFGTAITAEFMLCPLQKGIRIGKIKMDILERVQLTTAEGRQNQNSKDTVVASHEEDMPANATPMTPEDMSGVAAESFAFDESYRFKITLPLERSLNKARQSVDTDHLKIFHNLKIYVNLHNPDGHISQLLVRNLVNIFISPNLPVGEDQTIMGNASHIAQMGISNEAGAVEAPPTYERHRLDQLYDDIDPSNFLSGPNTPFNGLSRNASMENLNHFMDRTTLNNTAANSQLQSRLAALETSEASQDDDFAHPSPRGSISAQGSLLPAPGATSFRGSYHQFLHPPPANSSYFPVAGVRGQYDMEALARIPSYNTAVRTPVITPPGTSDGTSLPTYDVAVSVPASPTALAPELRQPPMAHTRAGSDSSSNGSIQALLLTPPTATVRPHSVHVRGS